MLHLKPVKTLMAVVLSLMLSAGLVSANDIPANFGSADWAANNWHDAVRYLDHLTDNTMQQRLLAAEDSKDVRKQAWHEFWVKYDPDMDTEVNEFRQTYFERVAYADKHFTTDTQIEGWLSDRGEAYVKLGPPANVQKLEIDALGDAPLHVWDYEDKYGEALFFLDYGDKDVYLLNPEQMAEHRQVKWNAKKDM